MSDEPVFVSPRFGCNSFFPVFLSYHLASYNIYFRNMHLKHYCYLFAALVLCGCASEKKQPVEYVSATHEVLNDDIMTTMPGTIRVAGDFLVWEDPFARDYFVHVHEKSTGKAVGVMGKVGEGPREFITGEVIGACIDNRLFAIDVNGKTKGFLSIDSLAQGKDAFVELAEEEKASRPRLPEYAKEVYIGRTEDGDEHYFEAVLHGKKVEFGKYPIPEVKEHVSNRMAYNQSRGVLASSSSRFPYLALYKNDGKTFSLAWENKSDGSEYEIQDDKIIFDRKVGGIFGLCMSKDYIIALQRDRTKDAMDESTVGRDVSKCPHHVFLYDYDGNLVKIVDLGIPVMRIAAEEKDNTLYAIGANPEYVLVKYEL